MSASKFTPRPWTLEEVRVLRAHYVDAPWSVLRELLPGRSNQSISNKANAIGLIRTRVFQGGGRPPKYPREVTEAVRALAPVRRAYQRERAELDKKLRHLSKDEVRYLINRYASL